jgi:hypothetical protein
MIVSKPSVVGGRNLKTIKSNTTYNNCCFQNPETKESYIENVTFNSCSFSGNITNLNFSKAVTFNECDFQSCTIEAVFIDVCSNKFINCNLARVRFIRTDVSTFNFDSDCRLPRFQIVPEQGEFIGWKKVITETGRYILKLLITKDAQRTSTLDGFGRKCRASKVKVLSAEPSTENSYTPKVKPRKFYSMYDNCFSYELGKIVEEPTYDPTIFKECSRGIHFFMTKQEAIEY